MAAEIRIQDMTTDEIADFLRAEGNHLTEEQAAALQEFIDAVGGLELGLKLTLQLTVLI